MPPPAMAPPPSSSSLAPSSVAPSPSSLPPDTAGSNDCHRHQPQGLPEASSPLISFIPHLRRTTCIRPQPPGAIAEIKTLKFNVGTRSIILFEKFGFTHRGFVNITVSMAVHTEMFNLRPDGSRDNLSIGQSPDPSLYFVFTLAYITFLAVWDSYLIKNRPSSHRIHHLMAGLLLTKALNLLFTSEDQHYVRVTGTPHGPCPCPCRIRAIRAHMTYACHCPCHIEPSATSHIKP